MSSLRRNALTPLVKNILQFSQCCIYTHISAHTHTHTNDTPWGAKVQSGKLHPGARIGKGN